MQYEDRITVATPEGVELDIALAGAGSRFTAAALDTLIQFALIYGVPFLFFLPLGLVVGDAGDPLLLAIFVIWAFLVLFGYNIIFETLGSGRTIGKRAVGIRVVLVGGRPVGFLASAVRNILRLVDFLPGLYAVGIVSILATQRNQRLGDLAAGTLVIREAASGAKAQPVAYTPTGGYLPVGPMPLDPALAMWDVSSVTGPELGAIRTFLDRRHTLDPHARWNLASELATRLEPKVSGAPRGLHPEAFLELLYAAKSSRA